MILKKLCINNFRSYYSENIFTFKDGLTLIIGSNGDGKTSFFDALDWLFKTGIEDKNKDNISAMCTAKLEAGQSEELSVSLLFEHDGEKFLEKKFRFTKNNNGDIIISNFSFQGYEMSGGERSMIAGSTLLERCFDASVRKYCLFKGESDLNIFENNNAALQTLVEKFSDIKRFEQYVSLSEEFAEKADKAYKKELKSDEKVSRKAKELEQRQEEVNKHLNEIKKDIAQQQEVANTYNGKVEQLEQNQEASEKYHDLKNRLKALEEKRSDTLKLIDENYNIHLLDDLWILCAFPNIFKQFKEKVSALSREKRSLEKEHIEQRGIEKGKEQAIKDLVTLPNGAVKLPWDTPDDKILQEMLDEEVCKVCGRPAPKGSEAYNFMFAKLQEYLNHIETQKQKLKVEKPLFEGTNIEALRQFSVRFSGEPEQNTAALKLRIREHIAFVAARKKELKVLEEKIEEVNNEKQRLLIQNDGLSEDLLDKNFSDLAGFFKEKNRAEQRIIELKQTQEKYLLEKADIETEYAELRPDSGMVKIYSKVHMVFDKVMKAFTKAKDANLRKFLTDLEDRANEYLRRLNPDDFHGIIHIRANANETASIKLCSSNGDYVGVPNGALKTTMYMSVLLAVSDLTTLKREVDYPLIFDAPTSSFTDEKEDDFYNVIDGINKQCIIVTKDLLVDDHLDEQKIKNMTCSIYRIAKARPFDRNNLSTIRTVATLIK